MLSFKSTGASLFAVALALSGNACSDDEADNSSAKANSAAKGDGGKPDSRTASVETISISLNVYDFAEPDTVLPDTKICVYPKLTECVTTDPEGQATFPLPANSETAFLVDGTARDYTKALFTLTTGAEDLKDQYYGLLSKARRQESADANDYKVDPDKGILVAQTATSDLSAGVEGVTVTLTPAAGVGPIYLGTEGKLDKSLTAISSAGIAVFAEVPPGDYTLTFSGKSCEVLADAWKAKGQGAARVPAIADAYTNATVICE